jgi:predicted permease
VRLRDLFRWRRRREADLDDEIASHLALATRDRIADGEAPRSAYLAARKEFGNVTRTRESTRLTWGGLWIERTLDVLRDVSYAVRLITRSPSYSLVVIVVLAGGIGVNLVSFGLFKALALAPLAGVERSGSLLYVGTRTIGGEVWPLSYPDYEDIRARAHPGLAASAIQSLILTHGGSSRLMMAELVTGNYFDVLDVKPEVGRALTSSDAATAGQQATVVISDGLWRRAFGADPAVVGRTVRINAHPMTVVGVAPPDFRGAVVGLATDLFVPITMQRPLLGSSWLDARDDRSVLAFLRPPDGRSRAQTEAQTLAVSHQLMAEHPNDSLQHRAEIVSIWRWRFGAQGYMLPAVAIMGAMTALFLVVVCANIATLVLVRSAARRGETAARLTLGATRGRLVRQLVIESLALAAPAAAVGFVLPRFAEPFLGAAAANVSAFPLYFNVESDGYVVGFTILLGVLSALLYGLVPAIRLSRTDLSAVLKDLSPRRSSKGRLRTSLVVAQVAVALMLLIGTALAVRTLEAAQRADAGFDPQQVTWATFDARAGGHDEASGRQLYIRLLDAIRTENGVTAASLATFLPLNLFDMMSGDAEPEGYQPRRDEDLSFARNVVSSGYFRTMGIPLVAGREFEAHDDAATDPPLIVNETFAQRFFGGAAAAVGRRVKTAGRQGTIVGVARDIKYARLDEAPRPYVYTPFSHFYMTNMTVQVRGGLDPALMLARIREHAQDVDPDMTILTSGAMSDQLRSATSLYETLARVLTMVGAFAAALAALGVYGLVAHTVRWSTHEIGVRTAVGATRGMILRQFLRRGVTLAAIGTGIGGVASLMGTRLMSGLLFGVEATDPASFAGASLLVLSAALVASFVPAWRASRVDPIVALRHH